MGLASASLFVMAKAIVISADEIKKTMPGYQPEKSGDFHRESARLADKEYTQTVRASDNKHVILLSGGAASGKTEYLSAYLMDGNAIILDGTLPTLEGFLIKYRMAKQHGKEVSVHAVVPDDLRRAFIAFLERERKFDEEHFYRTHARSRKTLLEIANKYDDVRITMITSYFKRKNEKMEFRELIYRDRNDLVEYLRRIQYTEEEIVKIVSGT